MELWRYSLAYLCLVGVRIAHADNTVDGDVVTDFNKALAEGMVDPTPTPQPGTGVVLTPWWDLTFSEGETVSVDCGYNTGGKPSDYIIEWFDDNDKLILSSNRIRFQNNSANTGEKESAYTVLTLTMSDLTADDSGTLTCRATPTDDSTTQSASVRLTVLQSDVWCGFESTEQCGWSSESDTNQWKRRASGDRQHGGDPLYDHTYGPSKHIGHYMDVDAAHVTYNDSAVEVTLESPLYSSPQPHCLHFYYALSGQDTEELAVYIVSQNEEDEEKEGEEEKEGNPQSLVNITQTHGCFWQHNYVHVRAQTAAFKIEFRARLCPEQCDDAHIAVDDIHMTEGDCQPDDHTDTPSSMLRVRLGGGNDTYGRIEVLHDGEYGTVCGKRFAHTEARVACASIGHDPDGASLVTPETNTLVPAPDNQRIWLAQLSCTGQESNLAACLTPRTEWGVVGDCSHADDVIISCAASGIKRDNIDPTQGSKVSTFTSLPSTTRTTTLTSTTVVTTPTSTPLPSTTRTTQPATPSPTQPPTQPTTQKQTKSTPVSSTLRSTTPMLITTTTTTPTVNVSKASTTPALVRSSPTAPPASTHFRTPASTKGAKHAKEHEGRAIGRGMVAGIIIIVLIAVAVFVFIIYKGRKRRLRKSKYTNFGSSNYSTEHLPTNEFHLESPLTMSSMGYTVLA